MASSLFYLTTVFLFWFPASSFRCASLHSPVYQWTISDHICLHCATNLHCSIHSFTWPNYFSHSDFLISNFRHDFECSMLSSGLFSGICSLDSNVVEHCVCSIFIGKWIWSADCSWECGVLYMKSFGSEKNAEPLRRRQSGWKQVEKTCCAGNDPHRGHG
jgi:hypothetical protein